MAFFSNKIYTTRLCLRKVEERDLPLLVAWSMSTEACGHYLTPENFATQRLLQQMQAGALWNDREKHFMVECKDPEKTLGTIHYWPMPGKQGSVVMALKIALPEERGKGYGTEAQKFLIKHLMESESVKQVFMYTDINNTAQQRCLHKLGFELQESLSYEDQQVRRNGHLFVLTTESFAKQPIYRYHHELDAG